MSIKIKQGDEYVIPVEIKINGEKVPIEDVEAVEFRTGDVRKVYPDDVGYDGETGCFQMKLTQEDTFSLPADDAVQFDVRVKFRGGTVIGTQKVTVFVVVDALSEEVI